MCLTIVRHPRSPRACSPLRRPASAATTRPDTLIALHLGVALKDLYGGDIARTIYDHESYHAASRRHHALLALAGALTEDIVFGERSLGCCNEDFAHLEEILQELMPTGMGRERLRSELTLELFEILNRPAFCGALDLLAEELVQSPNVAGPWAPELLWKKCPAVRPFLRVLPPGVT